MWDTSTGKNTLVNFERQRAITRKTTLALSADDSVLFTPSARTIQAHRVRTGELESTLRGHFAPINCCALHPRYPELYSGGADNALLVWTPKCMSPARRVVTKPRQGHGSKALALRDEDNWSD